MREIDAGNAKKKLDESWGSGQLELSMSRRSNCHDNAVAESFFSSMELERMKKKIYASRDEARLAHMQYIEGHYNYRRRYSSNGGLSPKQF